MRGKTRERENREGRETKTRGRMGYCRKFGNEELEFKFRGGREREAWKKGEKEAEERVRERKRKRETKL